MTQESFDRRSLSGESLGHECPGYGNRSDASLLHFGWVALSMKTETVCHRLCQCIGALCEYLSMKDTHRNKIWHFRNARHVHELTFWCYRRMPLLTNDHWRQILAASLVCFHQRPFSSSMDDIHMNPGKRRLCQSAVGFKWSSDRFHCGGIIDPDLPVLRKPDPGWLHTTGVRFNSG